MINFFKKKYSNIKADAKHKNQNSFSFLIRKIVLYAISNVILFIDIFLSLIVLIFVIPVVFIARKRKQRIVFLIGLEHVINKTAQRALGYTERSYKPIFFSLESTGKSHKTEDIKETTIRYTFSIAVDTLLFAYYLIKYRPVAIETYFEGKLWRQLFAALLARASQTSLIYIERGLWYYINDHNITFLQKKNIQWLFALPDLILYREIGTLDVYKKLKVNTSNFHFDHNKVRIKEEPDFEEKKKLKTVLYLNSFKTFRRVDLFVRSIPNVLQHHPDARFIIVGAQNKADVNYIHGILKEIDLSDYAGISINEWTDDPDAYFEKSSVFVLPATLVYCNYSLLEAMERGLASVSSKVQDADKIITSGEDGILCELTDEEISLSIIKLLNNEELRDLIARKGRQKIKDLYNDRNRLDKIIETIRKRSEIN